MEWLFIFRFCEIHQKCYEEKPKIIRTNDLETKFISLSNYLLSGLIKDTYGGIEEFFGYPFHGGDIGRTQKG